MLRVRSVAAEAQGEADAGVGGVVGSGDAGEVGGEDLGAVLDGAVEEHSLGVGLISGGLFHSQAAVEVADFQHRVASDRRCAA